MGRLRSEGWCGGVVSMVERGFRAESEDRGMSKTFDVSGGSASPSVRRWEDSANVLKINGCIGTGFSQG